MKINEQTRRDKKTLTAEYCRILFRQRLVVAGIAFEDDCVELKIQLNVAERAISAKRDQ